MGNVCPDGGRYTLCSPTVAVAWGHPEGGHPEVPAYLRRDTQDTQSDTDAIGTYFTKETGAGWAAERRINGWCRGSSSVQQVAGAERNRR